MVGFAVFDLHGYNLVRVDVRGEIYLPEGAAPDLAAQLVLATDDPIHARSGTRRLGS